MGDLGGGGGAQPLAPLGRSSVQGPRGAALYVLLTDQVCLWILRRRALATWATWRLQRCSNAAYAVTATSACQRWWLWTTVTCNLPVDAHPTGGGVARARTGAPHQSGSERARYASPAQNRRRPGFPVEGGRARASLGAALGAGRPWSDLVTNHVVRTVSKVLCLRSLRTSRWFWAVPVAVAASRNHTRLQLLLQLPLKGH